MTETTKNTGEKLSVTPTKTLTLKRSGVEQGVVRQSFSHGRSKAVVVEKVKRRIAGPGEVKQEAAAPVAERVVPQKRPAPPKADSLARRCNTIADAGRSVAEIFRRGSSHPDRGRAQRPCACARRCAAARSRRAKDRRGRGAHSP